MKRQLWVLVAAVAVTAFSAPIAGADPTNSKYYDASLLNMSAPTSDPCLTGDVRLEVQNYAVIGDQLYDLTPGHRRKIALAELDVIATAKQNDDRGIDFELPISAR